MCEMLLLGEFYRIKTLLEWKEAGKPIIFSRVLLVSLELWALGVAHKLVVIIHEDLSIS